jgi:uncharacterized membrane protein
MDGVDEIGHGHLVVDGTSVQNDVALVAYRASPVELELIGPGSGIGGSQDVVIAVAVFAGGSLDIPLRVPSSVDAVVVLGSYVGMTRGAGAVEFEWLPFVVGRVFEVLGTRMAVSAQESVVNRAGEDLLVDVEAELLAASGLWLESFVLVADQAVGVVEALVRGFVAKGFTQRLAGQEASAQQEQQQEVRGGAREGRLRRALSFVGAAL